MTWQEMKKSGVVGSSIEWKGVKEMEWRKVEMRETIWTGVEGHETEWS